MYRYIFRYRYSVRLRSVLLKISASGQNAVVVYSSGSRLAQKRRGYYHVVMLCLYGIISLLEKEPEYVGKKADRITPGIDYLENNFLKPVNLEDCAALCNMSYAYFKKLFTARFAVSPKSYLIGLRIRHAIDLLSSGLYTVGEVALLCGYKNEFYFSRAFTSYTGYNPSKICAKK